MSHSKQTANYGLPLFEPKDRPAWLTDFNGAMTAVDATVKGLEESIQAGGLPLTGGTMQGSINMGDHAITNVQEVELQGSGDGLYIGSVVQPNGTAGARLTGVAGGGAAFVKSDSQSIYVPVSVGSPSQDKHAATKEYVDTAIASVPSSGITQEQADARYLQLSGGTMTGDLKVQESPVNDASAVSKSYAQGLFASAISVANTAKSTADAAKSTADAALPKSGGTLTGPLILSDAPTTDNQAATKAYVDSKGGGKYVTLCTGLNFTAANSRLTATVTPLAYEPTSYPIFESMIIRGTAKSTDDISIDTFANIDPVNGTLYLNIQIPIHKTIWSYSNGVFKPTLQYLSGDFTNDLYSNGNITIPYYCEGITNVNLTVLLKIGE